MTPLRSRRAGRLVAAAISPLLIASIAGTATARVHHPALATPTFSVGEPQTQTVGTSGCGTNSAGEPAIRIAYDGTIAAGSELGLGGGSQAWTGASTGTACTDLTYRGQPNANMGIGLSGGDIDIAVGSAKAASGRYPIYVSSLNLASVNVAHSTDGGATFSDIPVVLGVPVDDREWIAAFGAQTALLSYHDVATGDIDVLRGDDGGTLFVQKSQAIPLTDYKAMNNELGNIAIDRRNTAGATGFWAYQSFVAPSVSGGASDNEAFLAVSADGGGTWTDHPIGCSTSSTGLNHQFPNISVAPNGTIWYAWSDDKNIFTATSADHGTTWTCSGAVSTSTAAGQNIEPWLVAGSAGVDLVYYGTPTAAGGSQTWSVYFAQNIGGWQTPTAVTTVHTGAVCESGATCTGGRELFDDFGVDIDTAGLAHIVYSHDSPNLGGTATYTGYAVQTAGSTIGVNN